MTFAERLRVMTERFAADIGKAIFAADLDEVFEHTTRRPYVLVHHNETALKTGNGKAGNGLMYLIVEKRISGGLKYQAVDVKTGEVITTRSRKSRAKIEARKKGYSFGGE